MSDPQLTFGQTVVPETNKTVEQKPDPARVSQYPGTGKPRYHAATLEAYLTNIERMATHVQSYEDWQLVSVDLLDNCRAALELVRCMS